jgi:hypothetical protein
MEYILDFSTNSILFLILLVAGLLLYAKMKEGVYRTLGRRRNVGFFRRIGLLILYAMAVAVVAGIYTALLLQAGQADHFVSMRINRMLTAFHLELFLGAGVSALFYLLLFYVQSTKQQRLAKRRQNLIRPIKQKIEAFYEELDHAVFIYLARKNGLEKKGGNFKDYRYFSNMKADLSCKECLINLYYALLLNRKYIGKFDDRLLAVLSTLKNEIPKEDRELAVQFGQGIAVFDQMEKKLARIMKFFKTHKEVSVVNDDQMPHFYIENEPDHSMEILGLFEELSIIILDNKPVTDRLLDMLTERINRLKPL